MTPNTELSEPKVSLTGTLGITDVVLFVLAFAAPISVVVATMTLALALGAGPGLPVGYLVAAVILAVFAVGYLAMSKEVDNAGAFYAYITKGLGRVVGGAGAIIAVVTYFALSAGLAVAFGFFASSIFAGIFHIHAAWWVWTLGCVLTTGILGYLNIEGSARVLGVVLVLEIGAVLAFDMFAVFRSGAPSLPLTSFNPATVLSGNPTAALTFAFLSFIGIEATVVFKEECRRPGHTIPRATFWAIGIIAVLYVLSSWAIVGAHGPDGIEQAAKSNFDGFVFVLAGEMGGQILVKIMEVLLVTSFFAVSLAAHNSTSRYVFSLGRVGLLPNSLAKVGTRTGSPVLASLLVSGLTLLLTVIVIVSGIDPYFGVAAPLIGLGTLGILILQTLTSIAIICYFRRRHDPRQWTTVVSPILAILGLGSAIYLIISGFAVIAGGGDYVFISLLPWLLAIAAGGGVARVAWLRSNRPDAYAELTKL